MVWFDLEFNENILAIVFIIFKLESRKDKGR